jgi:hypothetical protein
MVTVAPGTGENRQASKDGAQRFAFRQIQPGGHVYGVRGAEEVAAA